jgi:CRP/FNR family transcriptional regulator, cyclic AMP receptor protein
LEALKQIITQTPFFKDFEPRHLHFMTECATKVYFDTGQYILHEGEEVNHVYLICQGNVALGTFVPERGFTTLQTMGEGEILGLSWLLPPHRWHFSALVIIPALVIAFDAKRLREKCEADHDFGYEFIKRLALVVGQRLKATRMRLSVWEDFSVRR